MNCSFCGNSVKDGDRFCPNCGAEVARPQQEQPQQSGYAQQGQYPQNAYAQQGQYQQGGYAQQGQYQQGAYAQQGQYPQGGYAQQGGSDEGFIATYLGVWKKYCCFEGRARRREYWFFTLGNTIISGILSLLASFMASSDAGATIGSLLMAAFSLAALLPGLGLCWRRLHDIDKSGGYYFMGLIPLAGPIIVLVYFCTAGTVGPNRFGPDPKA